MGTLGAVRFFSFPPFFYGHAHTYTCIHILPSGPGRHKMSMGRNQGYLSTLSECLFFFGIYSFHFGGLRKTQVFQFLEAATPSFLKSSVSISAEKNSLLWHPKPLPSPASASRPYMPLSTPPVYATLHMFTPHNDNHTHTHTHKHTRSWFFFGGTK